MTLSFPAIIKSLEVTESGVQARLDISPPDLSLLADLVDQEVRVAIALPLAPAADDISSPLPFEPEAPSRPAKRSPRSRRS